MTGFWLIPKPVISCIEKFLFVFSKYCVFVLFCPIWLILPFLPFLYNSSGTTWDNKQQGKSGNYNKYSNGQSQKFLNVMKIGFSKMAVFALRLGRFCNSFPFCTLPRATKGTTNSKESLEIIIYIQTASHKNFSM